tara:strand:- start:14617 stop:15141 length:525 start_codon:yes stop_codon:yes gene_type:complete
MSTILDLVMSHETVIRKLDRMAREILEIHYNEKEVVLIGVDGQGLAVCEALANRISELSSIEVVKGCMSMQKDAPLDHPLECNLDAEALEDRIVFLIDDVLNSGRTLIHGVQHLLEGRPREVHTAVLVDRKHRSFPIRADFCGMTLSTQLNEHIVVDLSDQDCATVHVERPLAS